MSDDWQSLELPAGLKLAMIDGVLTLFAEDDLQAGRVCADFCDPSLLWRAQRPLGGEAVVRATGGVRRQGQSGQLIDATAGLGVDGFVLAAAGWQVTLLEQSPCIHALLNDALQRARQAQSAVLGAVLPRLHLPEPVDSRLWLQTCDPVDVVYLDPMFPEREKSARVKKNRYLLQRLHDDSAQGEGLLEIALQVARKVVVKRPRKAPVLDNRQPSGCVTGKTSRFDIYAGLSPSAAVSA